MEAAAVQAGGHAIEPAVAAGKGIYNWLKHEYHYVKHISQNFKKLEEEDICLRDKEKQVGYLVDNEPTKEITPECTTWFGRVQNMRQEIGRLKHDYDNRRRSTCLCGLRPNRALLNLGKQIVKTTAKAAALKDELSQINILCDKPTRVHCSHRWNNDVRIVDHPSLKNHVGTLIDWLKEEGLKRICIRGPPGVGKTTIMKTVHDIVCESRQFDYTFHVTLTEESRILGDIQNVICDCLGMSMDENSHPVQRATVISEKLKEKKDVLFLDEVSSVINLEEAGIHRNHMHGKVVFACRDKYIGHTDEDMIVQRLSKEDARKLFWELVGSDLEKKRDFKRIAEQIIDLCGGMPPILMLIGKHLARKNDLALWREMKSQLQSPSKQQWKEWEEYYRSFKLVYDELPNDDHKRCLLYWAIFPFGEEINRDYIIDCWKAEKFLESQRLWQARDRGHSILDSFTDKSLLEKGEKLGHFKMFACFQRAALRIANQEDLNFFVENGKRMESHEWIRAKRVSLAHICLPPLPERPRCNGMLTLLLHENSLAGFPGQFFECMPGLLVLCLRETGIGGLPSSISGLENLKGLFLDNCSRLVQLPHQIGDLKSLEILVVRQTGIYSLPCEIGCLRNLKCLRVSFKEVANQNHVTAGNNVTVNSGNCNQNGTEEWIIPRKILGRLSKLEELSIDVSPNIRIWNDNADEIAREITMLKELTHLHFYFPQMESFEHFILYSESWKANGRTQELEGFRSFNFFVGQQGNSSASVFNVFECSAEKHLKFSAGDGFPGAVSEVLIQAKSFELIGHVTACNLTDNLPADALQGLEVCIIEECDAMQSIINGKTNTPSAEVFQCLEKLHIRKLPNLVHFWEGTIASESFCALTTLTLKECEGIKVLFSLEMVRQLSKLQNLQVEGCTRLEMIIEAESSVESTAFPRLKSFQLCSLTSLSSICDASLEWPSLETILIKTCEELKRLPSILENASKLREIQCAEDWWRQQHWPNSDTEERFRTLRRHPS